MIEINWNTKDDHGNRGVIASGDSNSEITVMVDGGLILTLSRMDFNEINIKSIQNDK